MNRICVIYNYDNNNNNKHIVTVTYRTLNLRVSKENTGVGGSNTQWNGSFYDHTVLSTWMPLNSADPSARCRISGRRGYPTLPALLERGSCVCLFPVFCHNVAWVSKPSRVPARFPLRHATKNDPKVISDHRTDLDFHTKLFGLCCFKCPLWFFSRNKLYPFFTLWDNLFLL